MKANTISFPKKWITFSILRPVWDYRIIDLPFFQWEIIFLHPV
jgi:hypothetical protein